MRKVNAILIIMLSLLLLNFNNSSQKRIVWDESVKLAWTDFRAAPNYELHRIGALTSSSIKYSYSCDGFGYIDYEIAAEFIPDESWVKEVKRDYTTLQHEQAHFDITELYARKIRKALLEENLVCEQAVDFDMLIGEYLRQWRIMQMKYDINTQGSNDLEKQANWLKYIEAQLFEYREFKGV